MIDRIRAALSAFKAAGAADYSGMAGTLTARSNSWYGRGLGDGRSPGTPTDWQAEAGRMWLNTVVMAAIRWYVGGLLSADPAVYPSADAEPDPDHDAVRALGPHTAGPDGRAATIALLVTSDLCWGRTFLVRSETVGGDYRYRWVPPETDQTCRWFLRPVVGRAGLAESYRYYDEGRFVREYTPDEVVDILHLPDPLDPACGMSPLRAALVDICGVNRGNALAAGFLRSGTAKRAIFMPGYPVMEAEAEAVASQLGVSLDRPDRVPIVNVPTDAHVVDIGASPADLGLEWLMDRPESNVAALTGLAAMSLGLAAGDRQRTFSNLAEANDWSVRSGLAPLMDRIGRALTAHLPLFGAPEAAWFGWDTSRSALFRRDVSARIADAEKLFAANLYPRNVALAACDLEPVDGPAGDLYADGTDGTKPPPPPVLPPPPADDDDADPEQPEAE